MSSVWTLGGWLTGSARLLRGHSRGNTTAGIGLSRLTAGISRADQGLQRDIRIELVGMRQSMVSVLLPMLVVPPGYGRSSVAGGGTRQGVTMTLPVAKY